MVKPALPQANRSVVEQMSRLSTPGSILRALPSGRRYSRTPSVGALETEASVLPSPAKTAIHTLAVWPGRMVNSGSSTGPAIGTTIGLTGTTGVTGATGCWLTTGTGAG